MKKFNCPSCGGEVIFISNTSVYSVCVYCSSMVVRHDVDVESIGKMAVLPDDMSPLMIGSEGSYKGVKFHVLGRLKIAWRQGCWNEWYVLTANGGKGWLAEAQGFYAINFEYHDPLIAETQKAIAKLGKPKPDQPENQPTFLPESSVNRSGLGTSLFLNQLKYKIVDIKEAVCVGSEGELPFIAPKGRKTITIDLLGHHGEYANVEIAHDKTRIYVGQYVEWGDLHMQNLRSLVGWA